MYAGFNRGDFLLITNTTSQPYTTSDIVTLNISGIGIPIVHRIIESHIVDSTFDPDDQLLLTKADDNYTDDVNLYGGVEFITRKSRVDFFPNFVSVNDK